MAKLTLKVKKIAFLIATYDSAKEASKVTGYNYVSLCEWCRGKHTPKNKYRWAYI